LFVCVGTHKVAEKYNIGKKKTNFALEILNLRKKEIITMDTISNQDFTQVISLSLSLSHFCNLYLNMNVISLVIL